MGKAVVLWQTDSPYKQSYGQTNKASSCLFLLVVKNNQPQTQTIEAAFMAAP